MKHRITILLIVLAVSVLAFAQDKLAVNAVFEGKIVPKEKMVRRTSNTMPWWLLPTVTW